MPFEHIDIPERQIYRYNNGVKDVAADPTVVWRRINQECAKFSETFAGLSTRWVGLIVREDDESEAAEAKTIQFNEVQETMVNVARAAFNLPPLDEDGNGVTENFVLKTLTDFTEYREKKEPSTETTPSGSTSTVTVPPGTTSASSSVAPSTGNSSTASTSTRTSRSQRMRAGQ